jgi:hypothetical protein
MDNNNVIKVIDGVPEGFSKLKSNILDEVGVKNVAEITDDMLRNNNYYYVVKSKPLSEIPPWKTQEPQYSFNGKDEVIEYYEPVNIDEELFNDVLIDSSKRFLYKKLSEARYFFETEDFIFEDIEYDLTRESQLKIFNIAENLRSGNLTSVNWKDRSGNFVEFNSTKFLNFSEAVTLHIQNCFNAEKDIRAEIDLLSSLEDFSSFNTFEKVKTAIQA